MVKILTKNIEIKNYTDLDVYKKHGGYNSINKAIKLGTDGVIKELELSNLRGRGGAGFPTFKKWQFVLPEKTPKYLAINADEGEPGTFKDRLIMKKNPHLLLEGIIISCLTLDVETAYIYIRGEFVEEANILQKSIDQLYKDKFIGKNSFNSGKTINIYIHRGAGAYICGEETALINSIEGKKGQPRVKPPFPAKVGLFNSPTIVNNVETIANIPFIVENGGKQFADIGIENNGGTRLVGISGAVRKPGIYELPMGFPLEKAIFEIAEGIIDGKRIKGVIPGGSSTPILLSEEIKGLTLDFDSIAKAGSMLGSAGIIVIPDDVCIVETLLTLENFYAHESCGQCTPCREGVPWIKEIIKKIEAGDGKEGDLDKILDICDNMVGNTICPLADAAAMPAISFINKFKAEFLKHIELNKCPFK